jgi:sugar phosphate isomerase/epimerase
MLESMKFKYAICQELFENWDWGRQCRFVAECGYTGIEVAPFTLAERITDVSAERRATLRKQAADCGLQVIGLHWLLAKTTGLHVTAEDAETRRRTTEYLINLVHACADLGGEVLVFGSPAQRNLAAGTSRSAGCDRAVEVFSGCRGALDERGVTLCLEPLTTKETNFINTCGEAVELIERIGHPRVRLHQDVKAMLGEAEPVVDLIRRWASYTAHFHANDSNLLGPGMGATDFDPIFRALSETKYAGWVSVEVFDYSPGCERIARESISCMQRAASRCA